MMHPSVCTPAQALEKLIAGNKRFSQDNPDKPGQASEIRKSVLSGQKPFAAILSCSDSRVPPEIIFDQGIGDVFVIRNAGNILDDTVIGTLEYAVEHLAVPLIVVLGHTQCGAITAAVQEVEANGHLSHILALLQPAVAASKRLTGNPVLNAVTSNVKLIVNQLSKSLPHLKTMVEKGKIVIQGAVYHLDSGQVEILEVS
jgi:carbonic anhydrase